MALDPDSQRALQDIMAELRELTMVMRQLGRTMSALGDDEIKAFARETDRAADRVEDLGDTAKKSAVLVDQYGREIKSATKATEESTEATESDTKATQASTKSKRELTKEEFVYRRAQRSAFRDLAEEFSTTRGATARLQEGLFAATNSSELLQGSILLAESSLRGLAKATTSMTRDIYAGQRGAQVSARAVSLFAKELGEAMQGVGLAATAFSVFSLFVPQLKLFGVAIAGVRKGLAFLGAGLALLGIGVKTASELNEIAAEQNDQLLKTFRDLSRAGIGVVGGLGGLLDTLQLAGATRDEFEQFASQLAANSQQLAFLGTTTSQATQRFAEVAGDLRRSDLGERLEMLGIQAEEQRELVMGYMSQQARLGRLERMSREQLIQGSNRYARELDQLAQLTGASRKEQQDAREALMADERLRSAIVAARLRGDEQELARLEQARELAAVARTAGSQDLATAIAQIAASGGALTSDIAVMGEMTGRITEVLAADGDITAKLGMLVGNLEQNQRQLSETNRFVGTIAGYQINVVQIADVLDRIGPAIKEAQKLGVPVKDILDQQQREREQGDRALQQNVQAARMMDNASRLLSETVNTFNYSATVHETAAKAFQAAVNEFAKAVGVPQPEGGLATVGGSTPDQAARAPTGPSGDVHGRLRNQQRRRRQDTQPENQPDADQRGASMTRRGARAQPPGQNQADLTRTSGRRPPGIYGDELVTPFRTMTVDQLFDFQGGLSGNRANFDRLDPEFRKRLMALAFDYQQVAAGRAMPFISGHRTREQNAAIGGADDSLHLQGRAADLGKATVDLLSSRGLLDKHGFRVGRSGAHISDTGFRQGGISRGPDSGYLELLHGTEAVVPLPDGKSIPISLPQASSAASQNIDESMQTMLENMVRGFANIRPEIDSSGIITQVNQDLAGITLPELDVRSQIDRVNQDLAGITLPELDVRSQVDRVNQDLDNIRLPELDLRSQIDRMNRDLDNIQLPELDVRSQVDRVNQDLAGITLPELEVRSQQQSVDARDMTTAIADIGRQFDTKLNQSLARIQQMPIEEIAMKVATALSSELRQAQSAAQTLTTAADNPDLGNVAKVVELVNAELGQAMMAANTISSAAQSPDMKSMAAVLGLINPNLAKAAGVANTISSDASAIDKALDVLAMVVPKFGMVLGAMRALKLLAPPELPEVTATATALAPPVTDMSAPVMRLTTALEDFEMPPAPEPAVPVQSEIDRNIERIMTQQADIMASQTQKLDEIAAAMRAQVNVSGRILQVSQN
jgi:hypothetical protein